MLVAGGSRARFAGGAILNMAVPSRAQSRSIGLWVVDPGLRAVHRRFCLAGVREVGLERSRGARAQWSCSAFPGFITRSFGFAMIRAWHLLTAVYMGTRNESCDGVVSERGAGDRLAYVADGSRPGVGQRAIGSDSLLVGPGPR